MDMQLIKYIDRYIGISFCYLLRLFVFPYSKIRKQEKIKKILLIKFSGFGNLVLALPSIRAIRKKYPDAEIVFLTHNTNKTIVEKDPSINKIITFDIENMSNTFIGIFKLISKLKKENFDLIFDFEQFSRFSAIISFLSNAGLRVGFNTKGQGREMLYNIKVLYNNNQHTSKTFADLASIMGAKVDFSDSRIFIIKKDKEKVNQFFKKHRIKRNDILIGIHPGCGINNPQRKWPKEKFAKLADFLIEDYKARIFFTGSNSEKKLIGEIQSMMKNNSLDTSGMLNLRELSEIISRCRIFFSNDTGPLHLASAMKIPVAAFFGPNTPLLYGPLGKNNLIFYKNLPCSPCTTNFNEKTTKCKHFKCIKNITLKEVLDKIKSSEVLEKYNMG